MPDFRWWLAVVFYTLCAGGSGGLLVWFFGECPSSDPCPECQECVEGEDHQKNKVELTRCQERVQNIIGSIEMANDLYVYEMDIHHGDKKLTKKEMRKHNEEEAEDDD